jgi:AMMECR1 domain-containing protein
MKDKHNLFTKLEKYKNSSNYKQGSIGIMAISKMLADFTQFVSEAAMRIFTPTNDAYPNIGVQPFTGDPYKQKTDNRW